MGLRTRDKTVFPSVHVTKGRPAWLVCVLIFETWAEIAKSLLQFIGTGKYFSVNYLMYIYYIDHALTV